MPLLSVLVSLVLLITRLSFVHYCCGLLCPLHFGFFGTLVVAFGFFLLSIFLLFRHITKARVISALILLATLVVVFSIDLQSMRKQYFAFRYDRYQESVEAMNNVKASGNSDIVQDLSLPSSYKSLSACGGNIMLKESPQSTAMFFYSSVDWYAFSGYLYSSNGKLPDKFFEGPSTSSSQEICAERIRPNWYYCQEND